MTQSNPFAAGEVIDFTKPAPKLWCCRPEGRITGVPMQKNIRHVLVRVEDIRDGQKHVRWEIHPAAYQAGWRTVESLYRDEDRMDDYEVFVEWTTHLPNAKELPDEYLPTEVVRRRKKAAEAKAKAWAPKPKPKPKRSTSSASTAGT